MQRAPVEHALPIEVVPEQRGAWGGCHAQPEGGELSLASLRRAAEVNEHRHDPVARRAYVASTPDGADTKG